MKLPIVLILALLHSSCVSQSVTKTLKYSGLFATDEEEVKKSFFMDVPKGGKLDNREVLTGDYHSEYRMVYEDSSILYITNDEWRGSALNFQNLADVGINGYNKEHLLDTLNNQGKQKDGNYWREVVLGEIVVGYVNVPPDKQELFNKALSSIRRKK